MQLRSRCTNCGATDFCRLFEQFEIGDAFTLELLEDYEYLPSIGSQGDLLYGRIGIRGRETNKALIPKSQHYGGATALAIYCLLLRRRQEVVAMHAILQRVAIPLKNVDHIAIEDGIWHLDRELTNRKHNVAFGLHLLDVE